MTRPLDLPPNPRMRIALPLIPRNNVAMPGNAQDPQQKPVVIRRRKPAQPAVPPSVPQSPHSAAATSTTPPHESPRVTTPRVVTPRAAPVPTPRGAPAPKFKQKLKPTPAPPEDPAAIAARRAQRLVTIRTTLNEVMTRWPRAFSAHPDPVRPLAVGIVQAVAAHFPQVSKTLVRHAIALWKQQRMTPYLQALIAGGPRYDLDGNPQGAVSLEHQQSAREELAAWRARRQQKKHQATSQPDQPATASDEGAQVDSQDPTATSES